MVEIINQVLDYLDNNGIANTIQSNPLATSAIVGGVGLAAGLAIGAVAVKRTTKKRKSKRASSSVRKRNNRSKKRKLKFGSKAYRKKYLGKWKKKQKQPYTARKRKDTSHKRIRYTSNNQPYIILPNGKARFISKKNARSSKKRKGGKY
jgi:hypothetical protein